jgi:hypothetical protein
MSSPRANFDTMVPGFDFLQNLMKSAGSGLPAMGQWVAPTLDADEVDRRIKELRTVQFWLEQNAKLLGTTIQALEVQRMTLATLRTMNLPVSDLRAAMKLDPAPTAAKPESASEAPTAAAAAPPAAPPAVDPMQWWTALTRQFTELAANAVKDLPAAQAGAEKTTAPRAARKTAARKKTAKAAEKPAPKNAG